MATTLVYPPRLNQYPTPTMSSMNINVDTGQSSASASASGSYRHPSNGNGNGAGSHGYSHTHGQRYPSGSQGQDAYPTPVTGSNTSFPSHHDQSSPNAGPSRRKGSAIQRDIDGMEYQARGMTISEPADGRVGTEDPNAERSYTQIKELGDGSFGTVWLCDWHSPIRPDHMLSAMQCGAGSRPEWVGKRLVALKMMKKVWENGWDQAKTLGELASLRRIPYHPAVIPLYDAYISPSSRYLHFVFEPMEGNLYQLTKSRKGRPLAAGLVASCFHQISGGLNHIHSYGYFHRDMKPENLLVTTTGLTDYLTAEALRHINSARANNVPSDGPLPPGADGRIPARFEKDVSVIVKLADFGLARETTSLPPYTEYVSTRWYRAPEVLLRSREYGAPVDMWALGAILAEMVNLKPLFPGVSEIDQVYRVTEILGDPSPAYGVDDRGMVIGGGTWNTGVKLAKRVGFAFPKRTPVDLRTLFDPRVPQSLVDCIADLLRYSPRLRLTSAQCIDHPYFHETIPHLQHTPPLPRIPFSKGQPAAPIQPPVQLTMDAAPRSLPPSHSHHQDARPAFASGDMRILPKPVATPENINNRIFLPPGQYRPDMAAASTLVSQLRELDLPTDELASYGHRQPAQGNESFADRPGYPQPYMDTQGQGSQSRLASGNVYDGSMYEGSNPSLQHVPTPPPQHMSSGHGQTHDHDRPSAPAHVAAYVQQQQQMAMDPSHQHEMYMPPPIEPTPQASRASAPAIGKKKKWGLSSVFGGGDKSTTSLAQSTNNLLSTTSLKRTQSGQQTSERSSPISEVALPPLSDDPKKAKKEAAQRAKELEMAKREAAARAQKERARAVMQKRNQLVGDRSQSKSRSDLEFNTGDNVNAGPKASPNGALGPAAQSAASLHNRHAPQSSSRLAPSGTNMSATASTPNFPVTQRTYASMPPSASLSSIRSLDSGQSHQSGYDTLSADKLAAYDPSTRSKARRRNDDYDHSESDRASLQSRSVLTIGTIDSDPGPRRTRDHYADPMLAAEARRQASVTNLYRHRSPSRLMSGSNPSLESQLAHDFQRHAPFAASSSATSLGRHGQSHLSLHESIPPVPVHNAHHGYGHPGHPHAQGKGSAPPSPYGHPAAAAVAAGGGDGRPVLPSISQWGDGDVNPMFRVPPAQGDGNRSTTLPPFSALAQYADYNPPSSRHSPNPPQ